MIKEDRVREEYKLALAADRHEKEFEISERYFGFDYVGRELLKSFISGTLLYCILAALLVLSRFEDLLARINSLDYLKLGIKAATYYMILMGGYLLVTAVVYIVRYVHITKISKRFDGHLKRLNKMYSREEKLKQ